MPSPVDKYYKQVKESNPDYSDEQAWATAWSIFCRHKNPGSEHCKREPSEYLMHLNKSAGLVARVAARYMEAADSMEPKHWYYHPYLQKSGEPTLFYVMDVQKNGGVSGFKVELWKNPKSPKKAKYSIRSEDFRQWAPLPKDYFEKEEYPDDFKAKVLALV